MIIKNIFDLKRLLKQLDMNKKSIVFTNGCFDLLHKGHIDLLGKASCFGDILIVGLNSDESIKKLKGPDRPIDSEKIRIKKLLDLKCVNYVIVFNDNTPKKLIDTILPNVLVKGGDYKKKSIVGYSEVIANGGRVEIVPLTPGFSTTKLIKK